MAFSLLLSDEELLQRVAGGDPAAYTALYQRYQARLRRFLASWLNDAREIEDLAQEVLLEIWKRAGTYRGLSQASTWILGIARFKVLTARRRRAEVLLPDAETARTEREEPSEGPEAALLREERARILQATLQELAPRHREVLRLAYSAGCSGREIAGRVGCPASTARTRMFNAKHQLKQLLLARGIN